MRVRERFYHVIEYDWNVCLRLTIFKSTSKTTTITKMSSAAQLTEIIAASEILL